jgi:hypothetical protein
MGKTIHAGALAATPPVAHLDPVNAIRTTRF